MFSSVVAMNEMALKLLRSGSDQQSQTASNLLMSGIRLLDQLAETVTNDDENVHNVTAPIVFEGLVPVAISEPDIGTLPFYTNAIWVSQRVPGRGSHVQEPEEVCSLLQSILLYNLGLCLQVQANFVGGTNHTLLLTESANAYDTALGIVGALSPHGLSALIELASLNNRAHVHNSFSEVCQVDNCVTLMKIALDEISGMYSSRGCRLPWVFSAFACQIFLNRNSSAVHAPAA